MVMIGRKVLVKNSNGDIIEEYNSATEAANHYGINSSTMSYRAKTGFQKDGKTFTYDSNQLPPSRRKRSMPKHEQFQDDDVELNRNKYAIVPYEVKDGRICITPCPFHNYPKPLVGSGKCINCSSFRGRNKKTHEVACNNSLGKN